MCFNEVTVCYAGFEFMVHLDDNGEPIRMYTWADKSWKAAQKELPYLRGAVKELFDARNYIAGSNPLFTYAEHESFVKRMWDLLLEKRYTSEEVQ